MKSEARSRASRPRDQDPSAFSSILQDLVRGVPGAFAAALVDNEGECVDYALASMDAEPFDVKVAAAHWAIALHEIRQHPAVGHAQTIICRGDKRSFIVRTLPGHYAIVVLLKRRAGFVSAARALDACERALAREAMWNLGKGRGIWIAVDVETDERARPIGITIGELSCSVEVLGALTRLRGRERGFRVRLPSGNELNLVREVGNRWYADENLG